MATETTPRQVKLLYCTLMSPGLEARAVDPTATNEIRREGITLIPHLEQISIFESIFDNTISGSVTLMDNLGLIEFVPIVGVEIVWIGFSVLDGQDEEHKFERGFRVTRVRDVSYPRHGYRRYTLDLATNEFVTSMSSRICRNFEGKRVDEAVVTVLQKDLQIDAKRLKRVEPTWGVINATIPNYTPLQAINYFTLLAQTTKTPRESNFLFYETLDGFWFESITAMITRSKGRTLPLFKFDPGQVTGGFVDDKTVRFSIIRMHQDQTVDLMADITGGMLRSKMVHFDFLARKLAHVEDSRYTDTFKQTTHLAPYPLYPNNFDLSVSKNTRIFTFPSNMWSANSSYLNSVERTPESKMWESIVLRNRQLREIQHFQTLIDTPGHPELRAGVVIDVRYPPSHVLQGDTDVSISQPIKDVPTPYYSGPHLITGLKHQLTMLGSGHMEYRMHMRVTKDSLGMPLLGTRSTVGL